MIPPFVTVTPWAWLPNQAVKVRRYFVFNAFPFAHRKHLATAWVLSGADFANPGLSYLALDDAAVRELCSVMEGVPPTNPNTVRFRDYDTLPADRKE